jgi:hypothetical protein
MMSACFEMLKHDCQRFARLAGAAERGSDRLTPRQIARTVRWGDTSVRNIARDNWDPKSLQLLRDIERAYHAHPDWHPKRVLDIRSAAGDDGYVFRRLVDPETAPEFAGLLERWRLRPDDASFVAEALRDHGVTLVDVAAEEPGDFLVRHYAPRLLALHGFDKTGIRFRNNRSFTYARSIMADFSACKTSGAPMSRDVFCWYRRPSEAIMFRGAMFPCLNEGVIVSKAIVCSGPSVRPLPLPKGPSRAMVPARSHGHLRGALSSGTSTR